MHLQSCHCPKKCVLPSVSNCIHNRSCSLVELRPIFAMIPHFSVLSLCQPLKLTRSASDPLEKKGKDVRVFAGGQSYRMTSVREGSKVEFKFSPAASPAAEPPSIPAPASAPSIAALSSASMTASSCGSAVASSAPSAVATSVVPSSTAAKHVEVIGSGASPFVLPAAAASILPAALSSFTSSPQVHSHSDS